MPQDDPSVQAGATAEGKGAEDKKDESSVVDPLADVLKEVRTETANAVQAPVVARLETLPFGADKWGRDVLKKVIKGSETSIFVGLASAVVAVFLGTILGALAGFYGKWIDDFLNWFYNIFTSIPYLLLILAIAAVLNKKGMMTIILILGLTGWTGTFRLIRGEYLKHKGREYVQAADAIGASNARRMFVHIFPQHQPRGAGAAFDTGGCVHQVRSHPFVPGFRRPGRRGVVGIDAQRGAERADPRQVVAARGSGNGDGVAGHRVQPVHRRAARCPGSQAEMIRDSKETRP